MADFDIFNLSISDVDTHETENKSSQNDIYKPSADDGKDGTYKALIRFVPNPKNPRQSLVKKYVHWLTDANGDGRLVDSPSTVGEACPIAEAFFKLRKSDSAVDRKMSDKLKRREQYYSLIKIIKDPQNPELEGTYKVFKFGYKIKEKIEEETKPAFGEPTQIYDLFEGKNFELIITRQGEYNNYDKSKFSPSKAAVILNGKPAERNQENMAAIKTELDAAPVLDPYEYKSWDDNTRDFVNGILRQYLNPGTSLDEVVPSSKKTSAPKKVESTSEVFTQAAATSETKTEKKADSADDLDSFLNDLDL
jgi:hypothetical protein